LSDVTLGINYGIGLTTQRSQLINLSAPDGAQLLQGPKLDIMKSNVHNIGLIVGFTYYIRRPVKKEIPD
jgi:hypothetical protein